MSADGYLVQYGRAGFVGRFTNFPAGMDRDTRVVVRGPRGIELGLVLCPIEAEHSGALDPAAGGELLRVATDDDLATASERERFALTLLADAEHRAGAVGLPITFLDAEVMLDCSAAILHTLPYEPCDGDSFLAELSLHSGVPLRMYDVARLPTASDPPEPSTACGSSGCGSGSCSSCGSKAGGCSSGGCSRGHVKTSDELTAYFADLRTQMESRRTPLH